MGKLQKISKFRRLILWVEGTDAITSLATWIKSHWKGLGPAAVVLAMVRSMWVWWGSQEPSTQWLIGVGLLVTTAAAFEWAWNSLSMKWRRGSKPASFPSLATVREWRAFMEEYEILPAGPHEGPNLLYEPMYIEMLPHLLEDTIEAIKVAGEYRVTMLDMGKARKLILRDLGVLERQITQ